MTYEKELAAAVEITRDAGEMLRAAFHQPGRDRDADSLDATVERMIRQRLGAAFPTYGQLGEELHDLDRAGTDRDGHVWVIDPLDGSSHFERGRRGSAVSIALLKGGLPVLGCVFAFNSPNDNGDIIAWAEGQSLARNGREVQRRPLANALKSEHTVLLAPAAERDVKGSAELVEPARFRVMPSIAYRLALVAVGEAEAAVSVNAPVSWDYAAGHALLRAVGGDLFDGEGNPVTYGLDGHGFCGGTCIGGSSAVSKALAEKHSHSRATGWASNASSRPATRRLGRTIADAGVLSRAQGCLIGQIAGDSLGSLVEFQSAAQIASTYPYGVRELKDGGTWGTIAGQPTDDSELALALARSLVEHGEFDVNAVARAYGDWLLSGPFDVGATTSTAFHHAARDKSKPAAAARKAANRASQANGGLMRISPLAIFGWDLPAEKLAALARKDAMLSHPNRVCQDANAVFVVAIQRALKTNEDGAKVYGFARDWAAKEGICDDVFQWLCTAEKEPPSDFQSHIGWVRTALQTAFFQLLHAESFEEGVMNTVARGGDTDTNACIAGALLGAVHGIEAIPFRWVDRVLTCSRWRGLLV